MCCFRNQYQNQRGKNFRHSLYWIFTPGIALESWKILSGNFLFLELKNPGKFCPGRKLSWNFLKNNFAKKIFFLEFTVLEFSIPGIFHSWNSVLELSVPGILFQGIFLLPIWKIMGFANFFRSKCLDFNCSNDNFF